MKYFELHIMYTSSHSSPQQYCAHIAEHCSDEFENDAALCKLQTQAETTKSPFITRYKVEEATMLGIYVMH